MLSSKPRTFSRCWGSESWDSSSCELEARKPLAQEPGRLVLVINALVLPLCLLRAAVLGKKAKLFLEEIEAQF